MNPDASSETIDHNRRRFLGAAAMTAASFHLVIFNSANAETIQLKTIKEDNSMTTAATLQEGAKQSTDPGVIRPFHVHVPEAELTELRRRINATKFPERETVTDATQGVQLATTQALARYWATEYDWRKIEARMNALPQFITEIDGLDIHFIHVRSKHENALPLIVTHGWALGIK